MKILKEKNGNITKQGPGISNSWAFWILRPLDRPDSQVAETL